MEDSRQEGSERQIRSTSAVDLTFASVFPRVLKAIVKSKTALESYLSSVPLVLTFVKELAAT